MPSLSVLSLTSNGYRLDDSPARLGRLTASDPAEPLDRLAARYEEQGYLWLKGLLSRDEVLAFRRYFFGQFATTGLLAPGTDPGDGIASSAPEAGGNARKVLFEIVRSAAYESFCLKQQLWMFLDRFLGGMSYLHKRKLIRYTKPGDASSTGAHYDLVYLRGGTRRLVTAWIPVGDVPVRMGGLVYLEGSHSLGRRLEDEFASANADLPPDERVSAFNRNMSETGWISKNLPEMAERFDRRWLVADYEAGDVVLHSPYTIHAATTNADPHGVMRLSTDIRYQPVADDIDARWSSHWSPDDGL
ncbi:phytanoyl-CoA dioxygenase family protein [Kumtagia ephedrae]|uniref:Dehydrogenase n=1 Tax=Kumtagia ephedrae TaxID=2116701 RepID=A0A2P7SP95_9HYPH|nr:phytanoyl-CoA dioxygenase family protein [Mesorhizobium ephedrae]PSJ64278.1 dehydrogenase [Mesorhizobium ephedrae]